MIKAYIINLSSAKERRELMSKQISTIQGIEFEFFNALSYEDERFLALKKHWDWDGLIKLYRGRSLTNGEKACFASHYTLWEQCIQNQESIIILEDDLIFEDCFAERIRMLLSNLQWEFVRLMAYFQKPNVRVGDGVFMALEGICGTQGYFLTPHAASLLLKKAKIWFCPVDNYMDKEYLHGVKTLFLNPSIISENPALQSCIDLQERGGGGGRKKGAIPFYYKISRELLSSIEWIWRKIYGWKNYKRQLA